MVTQTITINLTQSRLAPIIMRSEEKGREIQFEVINEAGEPEDLTGYSLKFMMLKPDDNVVYADLASGILTQTEQMTTSKGKGYYCIRILDDDTIIYSGQGPVVIDDHVIDDETLESISEVDGYVFPDDFATVDQIEDIIESLGFAKIDDTHQNYTETWSSETIMQKIESGANDLIHDNQIALDHTWSSEKINTELNGKAMIDDNTVSSQDTWSSSKIQSEMPGITQSILYTAESMADTVINVDLSGYDLYIFHVNDTLSTYQIAPGEVFTKSVLDVAKTNNVPLVFFGYSSQYASYNISGNTLTYTSGANRIVMIVGIKLS